MLEGHKVVALCCSEIQNENTQSMVYPLYQALSQKGWKCILFNSATDLFRDTAFDRGEASIFQLIHYDFVDAVVLYAADLKNQAIVEDIIAGANAHHKPVFVVDGNGNFSHCIDISFDEQHAFRDLVTHLVEKHIFKSLHALQAFAEIQLLNPVSRLFGMYWKSIRFHFLRNGSAMGTSMPFPHVL